MHTIYLYGCTAVCFTHSGGNTLPAIFILEEMSLFPLVKNEGFIICLSQFAWKFMTKYPGIIKVWLRTFKGMEVCAANTDALDFNHRMTGQWWCPLYPGIPVHRVFMAAISFFFINFQALISAPAEMDIAAIYMNKLTGRMSWFAGQQKTKPYQQSFRSCHPGFPAVSCQWFLLISFRCFQGLGAMFRKQVSSFRYYYSIHPYTVFK